MDILQKEYVRSIRQVNLYNLTHEMQRHEWNFARLLLLLVLFLLALCHSLCPFNFRLGLILRFGRMSKYDHMYFPCDVRKFKWDEYCYNYTLGLLRYIGQETLDDFDRARRRMRKFRIAHFFVLIIYYSLLALIFYGFSHLFSINAMVSGLIHYTLDVVE